MRLAAILLSLLTTLVLSFLAAASTPRASALPEGSTLTPAQSPPVNPTVNPTTIPRPPLKCLTKGIMSYCIPNTTKYQVCSPTAKQVECPIDSYCKETKDSKGNTVAYCKFIG